MVCVLRTLAERSEIRTPTDGPDIWKKTVELWQIFLPAVLMTGRKAKLVHAGYTILHGMAEPLAATPPMRQAASKPQDYPGAKVNVL